jgi:hypothetical protein
MAAHSLITADQLADSLLNFITDNCQLDQPFPWAEICRKEGSNWRDSF